jgi:hypothetical protein
VAKLVFAIFMLSAACAYGQDNKTQENLSFCAVYSLRVSQVLEKAGLYKESLNNMKFYSGVTKLLYTQFDANKSNDFLNKFLSDNSDLTLESIKVETLESCLELSKLVFNSIEIDKK